MKKHYISSVSYLNSYPFIYGIKNSSFLKSRSTLNLCTPAQCAKSFLEQKADIALIPVGAIPNIKHNYKIIADYCIGAESTVNTVLLLSQSPLTEINKIYLDTDSITSALLVKILSEKFWNIKPSFVKKRNNIIEKRNTNAAYLAIGDKCWVLKKQFKFAYDLFDAWHSFTSLPFVFAVWVGCDTIPEAFTKQLNEVLCDGINNKALAVKDYMCITAGGDYNTYLEYLHSSISYNFDIHKKKALDVYLNMVNNVNCQSD